MKRGSMRERSGVFLPAESAERQNPQTPTQSAVRTNATLSARVQSSVLDYRYSLVSSYNLVRAALLICGGGRKTRFLACSMTQPPCLMMQGIGPSDGSIYSLQSIILRLPPDKTIVRGRRVTSHPFTALSLTAALEIIPLEECSRNKQTAKTTKRETT